MVTPHVSTAAATLGLAAALASGVAGRRARRARKALYPIPLVGPGGDQPARAHDPARLTAAVLLDHAGTEVSDFLLPYELLAASEAFNVHAVAPEHRPAVLTGGLDVMPDLSFAGLERLGIATPDLIVVPHLPHPDGQVIDWINAKAAAGAIVLSICTGAGVVAAAGLLDGRPATAHWGDLRSFDRLYPNVQWLRGVRYVDGGDVIASAGITSGIDATLHVIRRLADAQAMQRAATAVGYTDLGYLDDPTAAQHTVSPADVVLPLRAAFGRRPTYGVLLRDGVHETAVAAAMDTYAACFSARLVTMSRGGRPVRSRHGLTLLPRSSTDDGAPSRMLVPSGHPQRSASDGLAGIDAVLLPPTGPPHLAIQAALDDLAAHGGRRIARFAAKRLEHRGTTAAQCR